MKKLIISLAVALCAPFAFAQTVDVNANANAGGEQHGKARARTHASSEQQVQQPQRQETRERIQRPEVREHQRTDVNVGVQGQERAREPQREEYRHDTVTTHHEERAENRGGKFFFRDREIHRHPNYDRNDWHFRIGVHDRNWYYSHYQTVILIDGCWYYEDGGFLWPAYGFDPNCSYPEQTIVFQF